MSGPGGAHVVVPLAKAKAHLEKGTLHLEAGGQRVASVCFQDIADAHALLALLTSSDRSAQAHAANELPEVVKQQIANAKPPKRDARDFLSDHPVRELPRTSINATQIRARRSLRCRSK